MTIDSVAFTLLSIGAVGTALLVVTRRNPIVSAIWLVGNFFCLAGLYLTLSAQFLAVIQIIVYAGAIMVLFVFVIMLLNLGDERRLIEGMSWKKLVVMGLGVALALELMYIVWFAGSALPPPNPGRAAEIGTAEYIGTQLFTKFLFPFEVTSLILTAAVVGAIVLSKKKID